MQKKLGKCLFGMHMLANLKNILPNDLIALTFSIHLFKGSFKEVFFSKTLYRDNRHGWN